MKVYGMYVSSVTQKVLTVFAEKGHEAELVEVNLLKGEDKLPEHLKLQPFGEIPVLEDDGFLLYESRAIIRYLDRKLPGPSLTPGDLKAWALMEQWISVEQSYFSGPVWEIVRSGPVYDALRQSPGARHFPPPPDQASLTKAKGEVARTFDAIDKVLANQEYLAGSMFSLAEIAWMPYVNYLLASRGGDLVMDRANVAAWWKRISARPSWVKVGKIVGKP
jgi:glutathione S-transferase